MSFLNLGVNSSVFVVSFYAFLRIGVDAFKAMTKYSKDIKAEHKHESAICLVSSVFCFKIAFNVAKRVSTS